MKRLLSLLLLMAMVPNALALEIRVIGLFGGAAVLSIDGQEQLVKKGKESLEGVRVVDADSTKVIVSYQGETKTLYLSDHIGSSFAPPEIAQVHIQMNERGQYIAHGAINGRTVKYLVDTGANVVAINDRMARSLGINVEDGVQSRASTASSNVPVTSVFIKEIQVGPIKQNNVRAVVFQGEHPREILLGMTFLQHVDISEKSGVMVLTSKY